jgi:hypothetical protein
MKSSVTANDAIADSARRLRWIVIAAMGIMTALYVAGRFGMQVGPARIEYRSHLPDVQSARYIADISLILLLAALFRLTQMLGSIASGEFFTAQVIARFRSFAFWLLLMAVFNFAGPLIGSLSGGSAGVRQFHFAIKYSEIITVGVTLVLFLLARLLERARRIEEENREFV